MPYTCDLCGGSGIYTPPAPASPVDPCPRCLGGKTLVESAQGLTVAWGGVDLGRLTRVTHSSASVSLEDVTGLNSTVVDFGSHKGIVRVLISGDITPGQISIGWIGKGGLRDSHVGKQQQINVMHPRSAITVAVDAILLKYDQQASVNGLVEGSANFQLTGV